MAQTRTKIAAAGTLAALGALGAVAASGLGTPGPDASTAAATTAVPASATTTAPVEVRTVVVEQVVHRTRRAPSVPAAPAPAPAAASRTVLAQRAAAPVIAAASVRGDQDTARSSGRPATGTAAPLTTRSSGGTAGEDREDDRGEDREDDRGEDDRGEDHGDDGDEREAEDD